VGELLQKIYETDPLCCPKCGGEIHPVRYCALQMYWYCEKNGCFYCNAHAKHPYLTGWRSSALLLTNR